MNSGFFGPILENIIARLTVIWQELNVPLYWMRAAGKGPICMRFIHSCEREVSASASI